MISFESMIAEAAQKAGMKVPPDKLLDASPKGPSWDKNDYPHFHIFCIMQLCRPVRQHGEHWENAKVIAALSEDEIKTITIDGLIAKGFQY